MGHLPFRYPCPSHRCTTPGYEFILVNNTHHNSADGDINKGNDEGTNSNFYANIIQKPKMLNRAESFIMPKKSINNVNHSIATSVRRGKIKLPSINK